MRSLASLLLVLLTACATTHVDRERFDQPGEADAYFIAKRGITDDAPLRYAAARTQLEKMTRNRMASDANSVRNFRAWTFLGPGNIGGRTRSLVIDPNNPRVMYAGTVSGGVFKTSDGGERWTPLTDALANLSIGALAIDPADANTIYAGTGEGYFREEIRGTATPIRGNGIFTTHDGGSSWIQLTATNDPDFQWVNDLVVSTHDSRRVYAATRSGVLRSNDRGVNWTRVLPVTVKGGCVDLALRADADGDELLASCGTLEQATVYRNAHAESDAPWNAVLSRPGMGRTSLAFAPSDSSIVYALAASNDPGPGGRFAQGLLGVFRSDDAGRTWTARATSADANRINTVLLSNPLSALAPCDGTISDSWVSMGWHCNVIAVDPLDPNRVWAAGVDLFRSDDGGRNWSVASYWWPGEDEPRESYVHADQHVIVFDPAYDGVANQTMFAANDGGVYRTDNARAALSPAISTICHSDASAVHFVSLNHNFGATQFYHGTVYPDGRHWLGGAQDNGTVFGDSSSGIDGWTMPVGGDGGFGAVDPTDPRFIYTEWQNASLVRSKDGGKSWSGARSGINDEFLFIAPLLLDPNEHTRLWVGGLRLWRSTNQGDKWNAATPKLDSMISAIAVAPGKPQIAMIGTSAGAILRTSEALNASSVNWLTITPRAGFISSIAFDPANTSTIYATYANFGGAHVWKSLDGGATWSASDGSGVESLPDIPAHSLLVDPQQPSRLFLGTDLGIFVSTDAGAHWSVESSFPSVITETLVFGQGEYGRALYAFTHGRGAWRAELEQPATPRRRVAH